MGMVKTRVDDLQPHAGIIGFEPNDKISVGPDHKGITPHGNRWEISMIVRVIEARVIVTAHNGLEVMSMEMKRMLARIIIVQNDLHNIAPVQHIGIGISAINAWIGIVTASGQRRVQCRYFRTDVADVIKEGIVGSVTKVVHLHVEIERVVDLIEKLETVLCLKCEVIILSPFIDLDRLWEGGILIIDQPARNVPVEAIGNGIEKILSQISLREFSLCQKTHQVHARHDWKICGGVVLGCDKNAISLGSSDIDHVGNRRLSIYSVSLDDGHVVTFNPEIVASKSADITDAEEVGLARLDSEGKILGVVHERRIRHRLRTSRVGVAVERCHQTRHLIMVPIGQSKRNLLVVLPQIWIFRISDDKLSAQSVGILASGAVRMVPISARLLNLRKISRRSNMNRCTNLR